MCVAYAIWLAEYKIYCFNSWKVCAINDCCSWPTVFPLFLFKTPRARAIPFIIIISIYLSASAYCINCRKSKIPLMRWTRVLVSVNVTCTLISGDRERENECWIELLRGVRTHMSCRQQSLVCDKWQVSARLWVPVLCIVSMHRSMNTY